jgi:hypothetical protein
MGKMKFFKALLFVAFLSCSAHGENSEVKPIKEGDGLFAMLSSNVAKIIVCGSGLYSTVTNAQGRIIARESILNVLFIIDCPTNIESAITALYPIAEEPASITFSGMLSMQYFVDRNDRLLAQAHIYCNGGTVSVRTNASLIRIGNEYKVITPYLSYKGDEEKKYSLT